MPSSTLVLSDCKYRMIKKAHGTIRRTILAHQPGVETANAVVMVELSITSTGKAPLETVALRDGAACLPLVPTNAADWLATKAMARVTRTAGSNAERPAMCKSCVAILACRGASNQLSACCVGLAHVAHMALAFADWLAVCITSWSLFSLSVYAAALGWCLVHVDWRAVVDWRWAQELINGAWAWCRAALLTWQKGDESHIDAAVRNLVQQRKRDFIRRAMFATSPVFALGDVFVICRAVGLLPVEHAKHPKDTYLIVSAALRVVTALCIFRRDQPTKRTWAACHIVCFGSLLLKLYSCTTSLELLFDKSSLAIRMAFSILLCDIRLTVFGNLLYSALMTYKFSEFASQEEDIAELGFASHCYQELVIFTALVATHMVLSWRLETEARTTIDAKMSTKFIAGLKKLLKTSYDVVVELDDQLTLTDDAKDLAGQLLYGPHRSLKGSRITALMAHDADKDVFAEHVTMQSLDSDSQCCAIPHVFHMRDSLTNVLCMEMWHTSFEDLDSRLRHLIGIKELANDESAENLLAPSDMPLTNFDRQLPIRSRTRRPNSGVSVSDDEQPRQGQISQNAMQQSASQGQGSDDEQPRQGQIAQNAMQQRASQGQGIDDEQPRQGHISQNVMQKRASQGQVTSQDHADRMVDGEDSEGSSVSSLPPERIHKRMVEGFGLTSAQAKRGSILHTLSAWNIALRPAGCCAYHDLIKEATNTAKCLANSKCQQLDCIHSQADLWQCPTCGILAMSAADANYDHTARVCYLCRDYRNASCHLVEM